MVEEPVPVPGPGESLVRVTAVGLCGSDLHWWEEGAIGDAVLHRPLVLGHEIAGLVAQPAIADGTCPRCLEGNRNLCPNVLFAGHGAVAEG